jgi:hypothetical protein
MKSVGLVFIRLNLPRAFIKNLNPQQDGKKGRSDGRMKIGSQDKVSDDVEPKSR